MNPNDMQNLINAQRQAEFQMYFLAYSTYAAIIICAIFSILIFWRLRDIADELRKFRIAFEMADDRRQPSGSLRKPTSDSPDNPFQEGGEERYKPKSS